MMQKEEAATETRRDAPSLPSQHKLTHKSSRVSAEEAGQSSSSNFTRLFSEMDKLSATRPVLDFKP